jgi:hypothetical protein
VSELEAGRMYTIGALKAVKRQGTARNYRAALEVLEAKQMGDRGDPLTGTINADKMARDVSRINHGRLSGHYINAAIYRFIGQYDSHGMPVYAYTGTVSEYVQGVMNSTPMRTAIVDVIRMSWARMDNQPLTAYVQTWNRQTEHKKPEKAVRRHALNFAKVLGSLYTEREAREADADPASEVRYDTIEQNVRVFFAEYTSRLSRTVKMRLADLAGYIDRKSDGDILKAERVIKALTSAKGRKAPETSKLSNFATYLHRNFEHKDAVSCPELISLWYRYGNDAE